jgi:hypothetical protein
MAVETEDKSTTIRLNETTKQMLASVAVGQESFNDTVWRLVLTYKNLNEIGPQIIKKDNVVGTSFVRIRRTFERVFTSYGYFDVVVSLNDIRSISTLRFNKAIYQVLHDNVKGSTEWFLDLDILNVKKSMLQPFEQNSQKIDENFKKFLYFVILEKIFKEILQIPIYGFSTEKDLLSWDKWNDFYTLNNLPKESFEKDVEKKLRDIDFNG